MIHHRFRFVSAAAMVCVLLAPFMGFLRAGDEKERMDREARLIEILKSGASVREKGQACRELQMIGSPASIPALAALLTDKDLSHIARSAPEAQALQHDR